MRPLALHLVRLVLAVVVPIVLATLAGTLLLAREVRRDVERAAQDRLLALASALDAELDGSITSLRVLAESGRLDDGDLMGFHREASRAARTQPHWRSIRLATPDGRMLLDTGTAFTPSVAGTPTAGAVGAGSDDAGRRIDLVDPDSFAETVRSGRPRVGNLLDSAASGRRLFVLRVPVHRDDVLRYVLSAGVEPAGLQALIASQRLPASWTGAIVDRDNRIVARTRDPETFVGRTASGPLFEAMASRDSGTVETTTLDDVRVYTTFQRAPQSGWTVLVGVPRDEVDRLVARSLSGIALLATLGLGLGIVAAWRTGRRLSAQIGAAAAVARHLGEAPQPGDLPDAPHDTSVREVHELHVALRAGRAAEASLVQSRRRQALLIEGIEEALVAVDRDWRYSFVNWRATELLGRPAQALLGREIWAEFPLLLDTPLEAAYRRVMAGGAAEQVEVFYEPWGRWYENRIHPAPDGVMTFFQDVTERKDAEERLRRSETRFRAAQETSVDGFMILEAVRDGSGAIEDFRWVHVNESAARIVGRPREWFLGRRMLVENPGNLEEGLFDAYVRVVESGQPWTHETNDRRDDVEVALRLAAAKVDDGLAVTFSDLSERARLLAAERRASAALREADRRKDEFLAMLAHELRNPLAPIVNAVRLLDRVETLTPDGRRALDMAMRQTRQMQRLIEDLLEVSRITRGTIEIRPESMRLDETLAHAVEAAMPAAHDKRQRVEVSTPGEPVPIRADPVRIGQVLENLLGNATKYTQAGGTIRVSLALPQATPGWAELVVADDGIGIDPSMLDSVFELFVQAEPGVGDYQGGLGIGLAMVERLVALHGGTVRAESAGRGRGATFTVRLPVVEPSAAS